MYLGMCDEDEFDIPNAYNDIECGLGLEFLEGEARME